MKRLVIAIIVLVGLAGAAILIPATPTPPSSPVLYVVRHAERVDDSRNSDLSDLGLRRAQALVPEIAPPVLAIYSTDFCRTVQTAQPLAKKWSIPIHVIVTGHPAADLSSCQPTVDVDLIEVHDIGLDASKLVDHIRRDLSSGSTVIVGHSDTVPAIVAALGDGQFEPFTIAHDEYDNVFRIDMAPGSAEKVLERLTLVVPDDE